MTLQEAVNILGVSLNVTMAELKKVYRALAKRWHPDRNPGREAEAAEKFKKIVEAFELMQKYIENRDNSNTTQTPGSGTGTGAGNPNGATNNNTGFGQGAGSTYQQTQGTATLWRELQDAILAYERAKSDYTIAKSNTQKAYDDRKAASDRWFNAIGTPAQAQAKAEYDRICDVYTNAVRRESKCHGDMLTAKVAVETARLRYSMAQKNDRFYSYMDNMFKGKRR